uniref:Proteasome subunit alpha type n=1 Tax=Trichuris muris TaxID=70415 RepID=A0A5S6R304_TRIMR
MFRNQYDGDVTIWSPQGRIHQIEYAMKAVSEGSATVGLKNQTHAVLVAVKRSPNELSGYQKKIYVLDEHVGISIAGLLSDGRLLSRFLHNECINWQWVFQEPIRIPKLMIELETKMQVNTQRYGRRPFGVGLLVAGYDENGPHICQSCPSGMVYECQAMSIGSRSQSARTYLDMHVAEFTSCSTEDLVKHGLLALRETLPTGLTLSVKNTAIAIVGKGTPFTVLAEEGISSYLQSIISVPLIRGQPEEERVEEGREPSRPAGSDGHE